MAEVGSALAARPTPAIQTVRIEERAYALPAEAVSEVVVAPPVARVPQAPSSLLGIGNLRGAVLPVVSLRSLMGRGRDGAPDARAIILNGAAPVALVVDVVDALVTVEAESVETGQAELAADEGERLLGAFRLGTNQTVVRILDIQGLLSGAFVQRTLPQRQARAAMAQRDETTEADDLATLITFDVAGQEFGFELGVVAEVVSAPASVAAIPRAEALVIGVTAYRDTLLPLLSLRGLLGFEAAAADDKAKVVVTSVGGVPVGLVADRMRSIVRVDPALVEPTPAILAARTGGEARIAAIYRGEGGERLISILAPEKLFREDVMQRLAQVRDPAGTVGAAAAVEETAALQFLVFRLGDDEFALPIDSVDEVARVPEQITRLPKTPKFLEGVINLRGEVLPVVDQRRRFDMPRKDDDKGRRLIVVRTERHRAGLIVDSVSEVLRSAPDAVEPAPELTEEMSRLVQGVINLSEAGRIVLVLDPKELLSQAERGLLDAFETGAGQARL